jgi:hypothetical protein
MTTTMAAGGTREREKLTFLINAHLRKERHCVDFYDRLLIFSSFSLHRRFVIYFRQHIISSFDKNEILVWIYRLISAL